MKEMQWFSKFDIDGVGGVAIEEFKAGFRSIDKLGLVDKLTATNVVTAIKSYVAHSNFAL